MVYEKTTEEQIAECKRDAAEGEAIYWNRMADVAGRMCDYWERKTELLEPQVIEHLEE